MEQLKSIKEQLIGVIQGQMGNLSEVNTEEFGQVIDAIKDISETQYYCSIVKAMEDREKEGKGKEVHHYYTEKYLPPEMMYQQYRDMDRHEGRMYFHGNYPNDQEYMNPMYYGGQNNGNGNSNSNNNSSGGNNARGGGTRGYSESYPTEMRDYREGQSPIRRKYYMEAKELHHDKKIQMEELEKYLTELSKDITEMIGDATPEETHLLKEKLTMLAQKIN